MPEQILALQAYLDRLGRRQRWILGSRALLQAMAALLFLGIAAAVGFSVGLSRASVLAWIGTAGGLAVWLGLAWPLLPRWRASRSRVHQADLVEEALPALRSRLRTVVDRTAGSPEQLGSTVLLARAAARAHQDLQTLRPRRIHPARAVAFAGSAVFAGLVLSLLAGLVLPVGPIDALRVALGANAAESRLAADGATLREEQALVGDIVLRYVYPAYTGLDPVEVPNSDGTIHAPPGTVVQISARTAEVFDAAAVVTYEAAPEDARLSGGRDLLASLVVEGDGTWRFLLFRGKEVVQSPDYQILSEPDAPPVVAVEKPLERVPVDRGLGLAWSAQDDYGIDRVVLEVEVDGEVREFELRDPLDGPTALRGRISMDPRSLGLKPGDEATLRVVATDNDLLGGTKRGVSPDMEFTVTGPQSGGDRLAQYHERLRDALLEALADFLVEPIPPEDGAAAMTRWVGSSRARLEPIQAIYDEQWGGETPDGIDATLVNRVLEDAARLFRFTLTTWEPGTGRRITEQDLVTFASLHAEEVEALEQAIWVVDQMLQQLALMEVAQAAETVAQEARELAQLAEDADAAEMLARLDQLERLMNELAAAAQQLSNGQLQEFVNSRVQEAASLMDEIRRAIAEGRLDDAREMMQQLAEQLDQLSEGLGNRMAQQQAGEDQLSEAYEQLKEDLAELEQDQLELAERISEGREEMGDDLAEQLDAWAEADRLYREAQSAASLSLQATGDGTGWRTGNLRKLQRMIEEIDTIEDPLRARDASRAREAVLGTTLPLAGAQRGLAYERERPRSAGERVPPGVTVAEAQVREVDARLERLLEIFRQLEQQATQESPEMQELAQQLAQEQAELGERQQQLQGQVSDVEAAMPTGDGSAEEAMQQAGEAMGRAGQQLQQGEASTGEGHQRDAAGQLREARQALERQMQEAQQMQRSMQQMGQQREGQSGGQGDDQGGESRTDRGRVEIPAPEEFQTPEAYRRALLEGMSAEVPDEFEALKRRYYEDLVKQ